MPSLFVIRKGKWYYCKKGKHIGEVPETTTSRSLETPTDVTVVYYPGMVGLAPKWVRLAPNETNPGLFQIRFQCIWRRVPNALKSDLKKSRICPIWGPIWPTLEPNLPFLDGRYRFTSNCSLLSENRLRWEEEEGRVAGMSNLASKLGQIGPKWDKSSTFSIS